MSTTKKYWKGLEELNNHPEFIKNRDNEFPEELSIDAFLGDEKLSQSSTSRRDFLKYLGFSVAAASLAACEAPVIKTIPYVAKPEDVTPGMPTWYASTYYDGNDFASILVKTREGRPIFIKPNRKQGVTAANARVTASVLSLYDSARLKGPMKGAEATDWATADKEISSKLQSIAGSGKKVVILTNTIISPSTQMVIGQFAGKLSGGIEAAAPVAEAPEVDSAAAAAPMMMGVSSGNVQHIQYDAVSYSGIRKANAKAFGSAVIPDYDFSKAKTIVSISADFIANWLLFNQYITQYQQNRRPENEWMSRHFQFESILSVTGSNADVRVPIKPSEEGLVAAAIYQHLTGNKIAEVPAELSAKAKAAADELKKSGSASLVVAGSNDENVQLIVNAINQHLGAYNTTINLNNPVMMFQGNEAEVAKLVEDMKAGKVGALLMSGVNPAYSLPNGEEFAAALSKVELSVSFAEYADESASKCKYITPDHNFLEGWNDHGVKANMYGITQPAIRPLYETRAMQESLLVWAGLAERGTKDSDTYYNIIRKTWEQYGFPTQSKYLTFDEYWNWAVHNGSSVIDAKPASQSETAIDASTAGKAVSGKKAQGEFEVVLYQNAGMGTGNQANNPWLQELPDPISKVTWDNYIAMNPSDMEGKYNTAIAQEWPASLAKITVNGKELTLPVFPQPGQARGTVGIALGYGRGEGGENIGKAAFQYEQYGEPTLDESGKHVSVGKNAYRFATLKDGVLMLSGFGATISGTGDTYPMACTQIHHTIMGRDSVVRETTLSVYKAGDRNAFNEPHALPYHEDGKTVDKPVSELSLWEEHPVEHIGHRWGMTIDLNTCVGCGNCLIACQSENNVPVVGKDEVRRGREMHWLRIDRYYSSDMNEEVAKEEGVGAISMYRKMEVPSENPEVVFMPMMCQHCNHAPCETVCPVAATTHSNEGLNQMAYNRCIGTRYCANNCPYKVRRFNWFNYPTYKKFAGFNPTQDDMSRLVLNPDVVVRTRGVMEKCSLCVQRIQAGKLEAKKEGRPVKDGEVMTACAESCPTNAITFGDWNDKESAVRKTSETDRAYQALEEVGVKPNIWYMVKVRNTEGEVKKSTEKTEA